MFYLVEKSIKLLFPSDFTCDICGVETFGTNLCDDCKKTVIVNDGHTCSICGRKIPLDGICANCKDNLPRFSKAVSAFVYKDGVGELVRKFKNGYGYLKEYFADALAWKIINELPQCDCIVSVPMRKLEVFRRGYNQTKLLAKSLSKRIKVHFVRGAVKKIKGKKPQKSIPRKERAKNVKGSFKVRKRAKVAGKRVLVIDDVLTTGATADEISKVLLSAGASDVYLATIASVEYDPTKRHAKVCKMF